MSSNTGYVAHTMGIDRFGVKLTLKQIFCFDSEWKRMKSVDSRECRNCHDYESMDFVDQGRRAVKAHSTGLDEGKTCIDCHKGIAHQLPKGWEEAAAKAGL